MQGGVATVVANKEVSAGINQDLQPGGTDQGGEVQNWAASVVGTRSGVGPLRQCLPDPIGIVAVQRRAQALVGAVFSTVLLPASR